MALKKHRKRRLLRAQKAARKAHKIFSQTHPTSTKRLQYRFLSSPEMDWSTDDDSDSDGNAAGVASWEDILGEEWWMRDLLSEIPELKSIGETSDSSASSSDDDLGDDENSDSSTEWSSECSTISSSHSEDTPHHLTLRQIIVTEIEEMYSSRYETPRTRNPKIPQSQLHLNLTCLKHELPERFRDDLRVSPYTFDKLVETLEGDPVFTNNSDHAQQRSVEEQVAIVLYRFGHYGNAASLQGTANWGGIGKGTVSLYTRRVIMAVLRRDFMKKNVRLPTQKEKREAKRWVKRKSCKAWRGGWCFVDGTLIPLARRPFWFGESYFDRKCRYSLTVQVHTFPFDM